MNVSRRIAAGFALVAAPALIALGAATASHADTAVANNGPSLSAPAQHSAFPNQDNMPQPGTVEHHHHQTHHAG